MNYKNLLKLHQFPTNCVRDSFTTRSGKVIYPQATNTGCKIDAIVPQKSAYETLTEGTSDNTLEAKTEEYYRQLFEDIDEVIAIRNRNLSVEGEQFIDFYNPRNRARTKIYAKDDSTVVEVNHFSSKSKIGSKEVRPDVKIWDLGKEGGLLKATVVAEDGKRYIEPIHATNSKLKFFDQKAGWQENNETQDAISKLSAFIDEFFTGARKR